MGVVERIPFVLDSLPGGRHMVNAVDVVVNWARANSLWPLTYGTACCAIEMMSASMARYDISRFGSEVFRASPRQADLFILAGTIVDKMVVPLRTLYEQLPGPKYVLAMGVCTISGGPFVYDNYSVVKGADRVIPVDVFIPGCPPRPEALFYGLMQLQEKIKRESIRHPWQPGPINTTPIVNLHDQADTAWTEQEKLKDAAMAEARKTFKEANPTYKPLRIAKVEKTAFPEVPRAPVRTTGLPNSRLLELVRARFPAITVVTPSAADPAQLAARGGDVLLEFLVEPAQYLEFAQWAKEHPELALNFLSDLTAVDRNDHYDVVVYLRSVPAGHGLLIRAPVPKRALSDAEKAQPISTDAALPTLSRLFPAADWHEREVFDLMGIAFEGHADLRRIFLKEDFAGHPLRKNYTNPAMLKRPY